MGKRSRSDTIETVAAAVGTALAVLTLIYTNAFAIGPTSVALTSVGAVAAGFTGVVAGLAAVFILRRTRRGQRAVAGAKTIEDRLERATRALHEAAVVMSDVEKELRSRQAKLEAISAESEHARSLASIDQKEAEAVRKVLETVVKGEGRRWFWLGVAATVLITFAVTVATAWVISLLQH